MASNQKRRKVDVKKEPLVVYFSDTYNYTEIAAQIRDSFFSSIVDHDTMGGPLTDDDIDILALARFMENNIQPDALSEFLKTPMGRGVILGSYFEHSQQAQQAEEQEVLNDMENDL